MENQSSVNSGTLRKLLAPLNFDTYTFRCSSLGSIMGDGQGTSPMDKYNDCVAKIEELRQEIKDFPVEKRKQVKFTTLTETLVKKEKELPNLLKHKDDIFLPQTCISYLVEVYAMVRDGIKKDIHSKYFEKGIAKEAEAIELLCDVDEEFYTKNDERLRNEFIEGECDIRHPYINPKKIIDIKNKWDRFTFQKITLQKELEKDHKWQGVGYMWLWNAEEFEIIHTLMNMPEGLIQDEFKRMLYDYGSDMQESEVYQNACREFLKKCTFDTLPNRERIFRLPEVLKKSQKDIDAVRERVVLCRRWLNEYAVKEYNRVNGITTEEELQEMIVEAVNEYEKTKDQEVVITLAPIETLKEKIIPYFEKPFTEEFAKDEEPIVATSSKPTSSKPTASPIKQAEEILSDAIDITSALKEIEQCTTLTDLSMLFSNHSELNEKNTEVATKFSDKFQALRKKLQEESSAKEKQEASSKPSAPKPQLSISSNVVAEQTAIQDELAIERNELIQSINSCTSKLEVDQLYTDNQVEFETRHKDLIPMLEQKGDELQAKSDQEFFESGNIPDEEKEIMIRIENCTSKQDTINLHKEIQKHFPKYPELKRLITAKKDTFVVLEQPIQEMPPKQEKPSASSKPSATVKPTTVAPKAEPAPKATPTPKTSISEEKKALEDEFRVKLYACTDPEQIRDLNRANIDLVTTCSRELRKEINDFGLKLEKAQKG